jgi:hypothetical protein
MIDCRRASQLISQSLDRKLSLSERLSLRIHTLICDPCRRFGQQLRTLRDTFKRMCASLENDDSIQIPADSKARIAKAIDSIDSN